MKMRRNSNLFNKVVLHRIIYKLIIFTTAYIPSMYVHAIYEDCEAVTHPYIEVSLCKIRIKNCKNNGVPDTRTNLEATCDIAHLSCPASSNAECYPFACPTNPNECANDNEGDGITNYTNTATIQAIPPYSGCKKQGETIVEDYRCKMTVTSCKQGREYAIPPGTPATAVCDTGICDRKNPPDCKCPTDPNECVNDSQGDNFTVYNNTEYIRSSDVRTSPPSRHRCPTPSCSGRNN